MAEDLTTLELLEQGHAEAAEALDTLKASWVAEDKATAARREAVLEAHAQGARDRDAMRMKLGGVSLLTPAPDAVQEAVGEPATEPAPSKTTGTGPD